MRKASSLARNSGLDRDIAQIINELAMYSTFYLWNLERERPSCPGELARSQIKAI